MAKVVLRGPASWKVNSATAIRPGDVISVHDDAHEFGLVEIQSDLFICLQVAGVSPDELARYCVGVPADEAGATLVLKRAWAFDLSKLGLRGTDGVFQRTWDQVRPTLVRKDQPNSPLYIRRSV